MILFVVGGSSAATTPADPGRWPQSRVTSEIRTRSSWVTTRRADLYTMATCALEQVA